MHSLDCLCQRGADPRAVNALGRSGFYLACWRGHERIARALQQTHGVDPALADSQGQTAHDVAAEWGHARCVALCELCVAHLDELINHVCAAS